MRGRSAPPPRVTFPSRGKSPKARQGLRPWTCRCGVTALFALAALRSVSRRATFCHKNRPICHFELSGQIGLVFSSGFIEGTLSIFNSWLGRWVASEDTANFILSQPIPLEHRAGGSKGATPPSPGVKTSSKSRTRRSLAYLSQHLCCYFPLREKVGRGADHGKAMISRSVRIKGGVQRRALALLASGFAGANGRPLPIKKPEATFRFCPHIIRKRKSVRTQNAKRSDLP